MAARMANGRDDPLKSQIMRILVVEDSKFDRHRLTECLRDWHLEFTAVGDGGEAWGLLQNPNPPDLVLLDWMLPGIEGLELCRKIRTLGVNGTYIYTVMLTAKNKKADLLTAMAAGADDYLTKPIDTSELRAKILVAKRIIELQQSLKFAATHDFLTRLLNRGEIMAGIRRELSRSERQNKSVSLVLADIDHFKQINDSLGHAAGDLVLKEVASRLQSDLRPYDLAGRYGGEEFLLVLPGCASAVAGRRADEIRGLIAKDAIITTFAQVPVTLSMGVAGTDILGNSSLEDLLQQADEALYRAKLNGRNRVEIVAPTLVAASTK
jgi:two-component system, cell cycle response regulator